MVKHTNMSSIVRLILTNIPLNLSSSDSPRSFASLKELLLTPAEVKHSLVLRD